MYFMINWTLKACCIACDFITTKPKIVSINPQLKVKKSMYQRKQCDLPNPIFFYYVLCIEYFSCIKLFNFFYVFFLFCCFYLSSLFTTFLIKHWQYFANFTVFIELWTINNFSFLLLHLLHFENKSTKIIPQQYNS